MANDPTRTGITLRLPVDIRRWARATGGARGALLAVAVLTLAAIAAFLFFKTRGVDIGKQNEALGYFRDSYKGTGPEPECWHVANLTMGQDGSRSMDDRAGVLFIRKFYPEYQPTAEDFASAKWGA